MSAHPRRPRPSRGRLWRSLTRLVVLTTMVTGLAALGAGTATAQDSDPFGCKEAPAPTGPTSGPAGSLDPTAGEGKPFGQPLDGIDPFGTYGYGGLQWSTYDLGCGGAIRDPAAMIDTMFGNFFLGGAKVLFAAEQGLKELSSEQELTGAVSEAARDSANPVREVIFSPWAGAALVVAATVMLIASHRGDLGEVMTRAGGVLLAILVVALSFGSGAQLSDQLSGVIRNALNDVTQHVAQEAFPSGELSGEEDPSYGMRNVVYRELLWNAWKDGQVGANGDEDRAWQLFEHQAYNRVEEQQISQGGGENLAEEKGQQWRRVADDAPPQEYTSIQGRGDSRTAAGIFAIARIAPVSLLQIFASLVQYVMYVFLALIPVAAPLVALLALIRPNTTEKAVKVTGSVIFGGLVAAAAALIHALIVMYLARNEMNSWGVILLLWVATVVLFRVMKPVVSLFGIIESVRGQAGSIGARAGRASSWVKGERRFKAAVRVGEQRHQELVGAMGTSQLLRVLPGRSGGGDPGGGPRGPNNPGGPGGKRPDGPGGGPGGGGGGKKTGPNGPGGGAGAKPDPEDPRPGAKPGGGGSTTPPGGKAGRPGQKGPAGEPGAAPRAGSTGTVGRKGSGTPGADRAAGNPTVSVARRAAAARNLDRGRGAGVGAYRPVRAGRRPQASGTTVGTTPSARGRRAW